jgi:hypothetical protein
LRPRVGERRAELKARRFRRFVQGGDARSAGGGHGEHEREVRRDGFFRRLVRLRREKAQDRPARQPD